LNNINKEKTTFEMPTKIFINQCYWSYLGRKCPRYLTKHIRLVTSALRNSKLRW